jgi:hypothetical protein
MKFTSNERGAMPVLLGILAVVLIAVIAVAFYNVSKARNKDAQTSTSSPSPASSPVSTVTPTTTPVNMFVVKELGIQFTVSSDIKDLTYRIRTGADGKTIADFSTTSLTTVGGKYCAADQDAPLGTIVLESDPNFPGGKVKQLGNEYLFWTHTQSQCSQDATAVNLANKQTTSFRSALDSTQLVQ